MATEPGFTPAAIDKNKKAPTDYVEAFLFLIMVPGLGIEPRTRGFSILCSTD
jgi:hypothetical protein